MVVQDTRPGRGGGVVHKAGYGTARHGEETSAVTGGRGAHTGRPEPGALADQDGPRP